MRQDLGPVERVYRDIPAVLGSVSGKAAYYFVFQRGSALAFEVDRSIIERASAPSSTPDIWAYRTWIPVLAYDKTCLQLPQVSQDVILRNILLRMGALAELHERLLFVS